MERYLCFPGVGGSVTRHQAVEVESTDRSSKLQVQELGDLLARVNKHECRYLNGKSKCALKQLQHIH